MQPLLRPRTPRDAECTPLLRFRVPGPEKCNPYNVLGPQRQRKSPLLCFRKKSWVASPTPHRAPGRPTDGATLFFCGKKVFRKKVPARTVKRGGSLQTPPQPRPDRRFGDPKFFFDKKFFEQKSWLAPPSPGRPTDRPTPPLNFFGKKASRKKVPVKPHFRPAVWRPSVPRAQRPSGPGGPGGPAAQRPKRPRRPFFPRRPRRPSGPGGPAAQRDQDRFSFDSAARRRVK